MTEVLTLLNSAFNADPSAMHALIVNRVPCNNELADDPFIMVEASQVLLEESYSVGMLGVLNGVLNALGQPMVAAKFEEIDGKNKLVGFCEYKCD